MDLNKITWTKKIKFIISRDVDTNILMWNFKLKLKQTSLFKKNALH